MFSFLLFLIIQICPFSVVAEFWRTVGIGTINRLFHAECIFRPRWLVDALRAIGKKRAVREYNWPSCRLPLMIDEPFKSDPVSSGQMSWYQLRLRTVPLSFSLVVIMQEAKMCQLYLSTFEIRA